jgi:hypothetical protein
LLLWSTKNPEKDNIGKDNQLGLRHVELLGLCSVEFHVGLAVRIGAEHACDDRKIFTGRDSFRRVNVCLKISQDEMVNRDLKGYLNMVQSLVWCLESPWLPRRKSQNYCWLF